MSGLDIGVSYRHEDFLSIHGLFCGNIDTGAGAGIKGGVKKGPIALSL